jgi:hypothetical protein
VLGRHRVRLVATTGPVACASFCLTSITGWQCAANHALEFVMGASSVRLALRDIAPGPKQSQADVVAELKLVTVLRGWLTLPARGRLLRRGVGALLLSQRSRPASKPTCAG